MIGGVDLAGLVVLVTRPEPRCLSLCRTIADAGGHALPWPAIEIEARRPEEAAVAELSAAGPLDLLIFVSRNAVAHGRDLLVNAAPRLAAIGPSTFDALGRAGRHPDLESSGYDSEALLAHPDLADLRGRSVFIVRGAGGRELLGRTLGERGATVRYLEVYRRRPRRSDTGDRARLLERWRADGVSVYTATSVEILHAIHADLGDEFAPLLSSTPLLTASRRVVQRSEALGHRAARILASGPDDRSLAEALASWRDRSGHTADHAESEQ